MKAFAIGSNQKPEGYNAGFYYTPEPHIKNAQLIVSQVGENTNWKMCVDSILNARAQAKVCNRKYVCLSNLFGTWDVNAFTLDYFTNKTIPEIQ